MFDKLRNTAILKFRSLKSLLLRIERSQLIRIGHVGWMPRERLRKLTLYAKNNRNRPVGRPRTR